MFAPVVKRSGIRLVYFVHDAVTGCHWVDRWAARTPPNSIVANSRYTAATAKTLFPGDAPEVSYLPVPASIVADPVAARRDLRAGLNTSVDAVVILQASRLERWKGQAIHLAALAKLASIPGWTAWFAGGPQKAGEQMFFSELQMLAKQAGIAERVHFLGHRSDVPRLMAAADVYCQPNSGPEPFGLAYVEALYAGLPVVASNSGGAAEIVTGECGVLCPPNDIASVSAALREMITNPARRRSLGEAAPARATELCAPVRQMGQLAALIGCIK
jgi:glycosyltransferase involved in cell wall biosynthesis